MASPGRGSYQKGANYERRIAKLFQDEFGVQVKRTGAQESAKVHGGDVNTHRGNDSILNDFLGNVRHESLGLSLTGSQRHRMTRAN